MRLLLIEDDTEAAKYLARGLSESGYDVEVAADGRVGRERALAGGHELVIADRNLPHVDGLSIVQSLRAEGHGSSRRKGGGRERAKSARSEDKARIDQRAALLLLQSWLDAHPGAVS